MSNSERPIYISISQKHVLSNPGLIELTPISVYTFTPACTAVMRERKHRQSERKWNPLVVLEHPLLDISITCCTCTAPCSAAWRHLKNSEVSVRPSSLRWLRGKQTCSKGKPLLTFHTKKARSMSHSSGFFFSLCLHLVLRHSAFHFTRRHLFDPLPAFPYNQDNHYLKCNTHQNFTVSPDS